MTDRPAAWYPDPDDPPRVRWWSGREWTEYRRDSAPDPSPAGIAAAPVVVAPVARATPMPFTAYPGSITISRDRRGAGFIRGLVTLALVAAVGSAGWLALRSNGAGQPDRGADLHIARQAVASFGGPNSRGPWVGSAPIPARPPTGEQRDSRPPACKLANATVNAGRTATARTSTFANAATGEGVQGEITVYESDAAALDAMRSFRADPEGPECVRQKLARYLQGKLATLTYQPVVSVDFQRADTQTLGDDGVYFDVEATAARQDGTPVTWSTVTIVARVERGIVSIYWVNPVQPIASWTLWRLERAFMNSFGQALHPGIAATYAPGGSADPL